MGLEYSIQQSRTIVGSKSNSGSITPVALTNLPTGNSKSIMGVAGMSKIDIRFSYTTGASETNNQLKIIVEQSEDGVNWFKIPNETVSGGSSVLTSRVFSVEENTTESTTLNGSISLDIFYNNIKVSFYETGVAANYGTIYGEITLLGK